MGLIVGQALQFVSGGPLVGVNHLRGHAFSPFIPVHAQDPAGFRKAFDALLPHLGLIVSGGNTVLFSLEAGGVISVLAATVDDAAGEALDKGAKLLGMPYPGGPLIEKAGAGGVATAYDFPRAFADNKEARFSFSGLKTSLRYTLEKLSPDSLATEMPHLCASYQEAVVDALARKTNQFLKRGGWRSVGLSGGVANNGRLKEAFTELANGQGIPLLQALPRHTGDNAGMIAFAAFMDPAGCEAEPTSFRPVWELA
jgi:N6-L-threonylcarbamoyladenine synthase